MSQNKEELITFTKIIERSQKTPAENMSIANKELVKFSDKFYDENKKGFAKSLTCKFYHRSEIPAKKLFECYKSYGHFHLQNETPVIWVSNLEKGLLFTNLAIYYHMQATKKIFDMNNKVKGVINYENINKIKFERALLTDQMELFVNDSLVGAILFGASLRGKGALSSFVETFLGPSKEKYIPDSLKNNNAFSASKESNSPSSESNDVTIRLKQLKQLLDDDIINQDDFECKKKELLDEM